jgi:5,5'-dehydrodivanillate O-demethylase
MKTPDGEYDLQTFPSQDQMAQETQGTIYDRTTENLGTSDRGIVMFRRMLMEQIERVEKGGEPTIAVVRDPAKNRLIDFPNITSPTDAIDKIVAAEKA